MSQLHTRRAFVGLSGPLFFDYLNEAPRTDEDLADSPNPVLDSPAALMLLYDEIWFLSRSLCPASMRTLPFVHFVLEDDAALANMAGFSYDRGADAELIGQMDEYIGSLPHFYDVEGRIRSVGAGWWGSGEAGFDSHSRGLDFSKIGMEDLRGANVSDPEGVMFDQAVINQLGGDFELVANSLLQTVIAPKLPHSVTLASSLYEDVSLADALTLSDLPTRLLKTGPDVDFLGELRESGCLPAFRDWVRQRGLRVSASELRDIESEVEAAIDKHTMNYLKKYDPDQLALSNYKTLLVEGIGLIIPPFSKLMKGAKAYREWQEIRSGRWSAFLCKAKHLQVARTRR